MTYLSYPLADGAFPTSSLAGARFTVVASSVLCGSNGRTRVMLNGTVVPTASSAGVVAVNRPAKRKMARMSATEADDKAPMKTVSAELVASNIMHFSWRHMCRKVFPCMHRNLTLNFKQPSYVFRSDFRSLCKINHRLHEPDDHADDHEPDDHDALQRPQQTTTTRCALLM